MQYKKALIVFALLLLPSFLFAQSEAPLNQGKANELANKGYDKFRNGEFAEALEIYNQAISLDPTKAHYFENRGHIKKGLQQWENALKDYQKANELKPNATYETYFQAGEILNKELKNYEKAREMYTKAIEVQKLNKNTSDTYLIYFNIGNTFLKQEKYKEAIESYNEAVKLEPTHANTYINRGFAQYNTRNKELACENWKKAKELGLDMADEYIENYCQ